MALRDFSAYTDPHIHTELSGLDDSYLQPEIQEPVANVKPINWAYKHLAASNSEPDTTQTTDLALKMEKCRQKLFALLLQHPKTLKLLSDEGLSMLSEGVDYTLSQQKIVHDQPVQNAHFVQLDLASLPIGIDDENSVHQGKATENIHFFPALLIRLAQELPKTTKLEPEYKAQLASCWRQLQDTRQQIIIKNTGLVAFLAFKYKTSNLSLDDLLQEGTVGLIRAVDRFDAERGLCFSTYAVFWIKQAISRLIVKQEKVVRLPVALAEKASQVFEIMRRCYLDHQRWPTEAELMAQCSLTLEEIKTVSRYYQATHSLDANLSEENDDYSLMDNLKQQQFSLPLNELIDANLSLYLNNVIASLPEQEATIINLRFGLKNHTEMTLQAIADQLQVTRERVRQIQNQALKKLKQQFGYDLLPFLETNDNY